MYLQNLILIDEIIVFTSPSGDGTAIFTWSSELRKGLAVYTANGSSTIGLRQWVFSGLQGLSLHLLCTLPLYRSNKVTKLQK